MSESKPSLQQLREQLLRFEHLKQFPDLAEEILSAVESANTQMEFEEREYQLLQEKEMVSNEKAIHARNAFTIQEQTEKQSCAFYNVKETPFYYQERQLSLREMDNKKRQLSIIKGLYEHLIEVIEAFEGRIYQNITEVLRLEARIIRNEPRYAEITVEELHNIGVARFDKCFERVRYLKKSEERRLKAMERYV